MKRTLYILLAFFLIIGSVLWLFAAVMLYADSFLKPIYLVFNFIFCAFCILTGAWIFKFLKEQKL